MTDPTLRPPDASTPGPTFAAPTAERFPATTPAAPAADAVTASLFAPPGGAWHPVSRRYVRVVRLTRLLANALTFGAMTAVAWFVTQRLDLTLAIAGVGLVWTAVRVLRAQAWVDALGWAERHEDLCIRRGLWTRRLIVVPYGRMQVVEVSSGPLLRSQGLASVQLVTAAAHTGAHISGLSQHDATALRDRMIELSDARGAGL